MPLTTPRTDVASEPGRLAATVARGAPMQRVLLIDDDAALTRLVGDYLSGAG